MAESTGDTKQLQLSQIRLKMLNAEYTRFSKGTGQPTQRERAAVTGFGKGQAARATAVHRRTLQTAEAGDIIKANSENKGVKDMQMICRLDAEKYRCVTPDITTDEVIITAKQVEHIKDRHPQDYERYLEFIPQMISNPDYIIEANKPNTAVILKRFTENDKNFQLVLRIRTSNDSEIFKNSIITFMKIKDREWNRLIKNKKTLYKAV